MNGRVRHPGYSYAYGSTTMWERVALGPFVCETYGRPNLEGMSIRRETFHSTLAEARRATVRVHL